MLSLEKLKGALKFQWLGSKAYDGTVDTPDIHGPPSPINYVKTPQVVLDKITEASSEGDDYDDYYKDNPDYIQVESGSGRSYYIPKALAEIAREDGEAWRREVGLD